MQLDIRCRLIDDICWIFSVFLPRFSFHAKYDLFIFNFQLAEKFEFV